MTEAQAELLRLARRARDLYAAASSLAIQKIEKDPANAALYLRHLVTYQPIALDTIREG